MKKTFLALSILGLALMISGCAAKGGCCGGCSDSKQCSLDEKGKCEHCSKKKDAKKPATAPAK